MMKQTHLTTSGLPIWRQIRWNLILYFLFLAVLPLIIVQTITLTQTSSQARQQVTARYETVAELKRDQVAFWLEQGNLTLRLILADATQENSFSTLLSNTTLYNPALEEEANLILAEALAAQSLFEEFFLFDIRGRIVASSSEGRVGRIIANEPYFAPSLRGHYIQSPYDQAGTRGLAMVITHPIGSPAVVGSLVGLLNLDTLGDIMTARNGLGETGETYLVSGDNNSLITPSRFADYPLEQVYHSYGIDQALSRENGSGTYENYRSPATSVIGVYRWIPELNAALLAEIEESEALAAFVQARDTSGVLTILAALAAVLLGFYSATRISRPIATLTQVASHIADGDLTQRADVQQSNEIGVLSSAFNQMTEKLVSNIQELSRATALAKESVRLKSEFMSTMSHELRTPLNAIIGFCGIILEGMGGEVDDEARHMLERVHSNSNRLLNLINEILDLAKIESGRMELVEIEVYPRALADQWQTQMTALAQKKGLAFEVEIDPALPRTLYADQERVTQIAVNLLGNAFKFTDSGEVKLSLKVVDTSWIIQVEDTGIGIPPHALNYIFDEFRQVDGSSRRVYGGSGLGLAIVRNLCLMMDGNVRATSELGRGSVFTVTLPLKTVSQNMPEAAVLATA